MGRIIGIDNFKERITLRSEGQYLPDISDEEEKEFHDVFDFLKNKENWKFPTKEFITDKRGLAEMVADVLVFFTGGAEVSFVFGGPITVSSKGYYHYIGC